MVTKAEALAELERRKANVGQVSASEARAELANREVGRYGGLTGEARKIAESGVKNLASFGSTEPLYEAETSLGRIFANVGRPFRPVLGAMELATAPAGALLREYVGEPVEGLTKNPALGTIAEIAGAVAAPSQLSRLGSLASKAKLGAPLPAPPPFPPPPRGVSSQPLSWLSVVGNAWPEPCIP